MSSAMNDILVQKERTHAQKRTQKRTQKIDQKSASLSNFGQHPLFFFRELHFFE